jgi:hypothetical protein
LVFLIFKKSFLLIGDVVIFCLSKGGRMDLFVPDVSINTIRLYRKENFINVKTASIRYRLPQVLFFIKAENRSGYGSG